MNEEQTHYRSEGPRDLSGDEESPTKKLAEKVVKWIRHNDRREGEFGWVAGVYGGRGTGKTSFLMTLIKALGSANEEIASPTHDGIMKAMLAPAATRSDDDLLFLMLDHLEHRYAPPTDNGIGRAFQGAREVEVRRKERRLFFEYTRDVSPSQDDLPGQFVRLHSDIAITTKELKRHFETIVERLQEPPKGGSGKRLLPIFVDDLDLRPDRALELLEIAHLFLNLPGVVLIVTADRDLLLHAIQRALEDRGVYHPGLAGALLAKYVPYSWMLPVPAEEERLKDLWPEDERGSSKVRPVLPLWWPENMATRFVGDNRTAREWAKDSLGPLLPPAFRGLVAMHNRLLALRADWDLPAKMKEESEEDFVLGFQRLVAPLGFLAVFVPPFVSMVVAIDLRYPELGLLELLNQDPKLMGDLLTRISERRRRRDREAPRRGEKEERLAIGVERLAAAHEEQWIREDDPDVHWPVLDKLRAPHLQERRAGEAWRLLSQLANTWRVMQEPSKSARSADHFLAISINADVLEASRERWYLLYPERSVRELQIDLRQHVKGDRPQPDEIVRVQDDARAQVRERLQRMPGRIEIAARAPISFLLWLGWMVDEKRSFTVYNVRSNKVFEGPSERLMFQDRGGLEVSDTEHPLTEPHPPWEKDAILLVNLTGSPEVGRFLEKDGTEVRPGAHYILRRESREPIAPEHLLPILRDIVELLGELQKGGRFRRVHLALMAPDAVAFFLGQQLKAPGMKVSVYELYGNEHRYVFDLE